MGGGLEGPQMGFRASEISGVSGLRHLAKRSVTLPRAYDAPTNSTWQEIDKRGISNDRRRAH